MSAQSQQNTSNGEGVRERLPHQASSVGDAKSTVQGLNAAEEIANKDEKEKKTFGRTPDGTSMCFYSHCE